MTTITPTSTPTPRLARTVGWVPTWPLIATRVMELRRRRGQMVVVFLLTLGIPFLILGIRLLLHAVDSASYGPAGSPSVFQSMCDPMGLFGFLIGATLGAAAGTTDLSDGVFRHLVITGRSRLALYFARIPAGLLILVPLMAIGYTSLCLVTSYAGVPQPTSISAGQATIPVNYTESQFTSWVKSDPGDAVAAFLASSGQSVSIGPGPNPVPTITQKELPRLYANYRADVASNTYPPINEMIKIGLWLELVLATGFVVGLGLGSLTGQRTVSTILLIALELIVTPILSRVVIPYFINGQRLIVGVALDQLRPAALTNGLSGTTHGGGGGQNLGIPPMPTWAMVAVIVGWFVVWSALGACRMARRDA